MEKLCWDAPKGIEPSPGFWVSEHIIIIILKYAYNDGPKTILSWLVLSRRLAFCDTPKLLVDWGASQGLSMTAQIVVGCW